MILSKMINSLSKTDEFIKNDNFLSKADAFLENDKLT